MSGGVDSTSCALILKEHADVTGFFMQLAQPDLDQQREHVKNLAARLEIDLQIIDLKEQFQQRVLDYFSSSYTQGLTPNPCMVCNKEIKFGLFMDTILEEGMDLVATGHYARIEKKGATFHLLQGRDPGKDQSYFLARLSQEQLARVIFPLGEKTKEEIYTFSENSGFTEFRGQESQDVCFLEETKVADYLQQSIDSKNRSGPIVSLDGQILGKHQGVYRYTIGQRRGLGIPDTTPWYVVRIEPETNSVIVGKNDDLQQKIITINNLHWMSGKQPDLNQEFQVRIRYSHKGSSARLTLVDEHTCTISFASEQRAITPGQFAVIYDREEVIGSGVIV